MKKRMAMIFLLVCMLAVMLPSCAQAALNLKNYNAFKKQYLQQHNFWFWNSDKYTCYAQWERVSGGVNFKIKMKNDFPYDDVDAYTFEIYAKNAYEEPILLKSSDGEYCSSLYYSGERKFKPGSSGYTESFRLRAKEKIRYVYVKLIKYHTTEGTIYVDESQQSEYYWKIN